MLRISPEQVDLHEADKAEDASSLDQLLQAWEDAKSAELSANKRRAEIETQLCLLLSAPEEGQKSYRIGPRKVTRSNKINYKGNLELVLKFAAELELAPLWKQTLDETAIKRLRKNDPYDFELLIAEGALTMTPAKPHFEVALVPTADLVT